MAPNHPRYYRGLFTLDAVMMGIIVVQFLSSRPRIASTILESSLLVGIGRISYSLYLWHIPMHHWLQPMKFGWKHPTNTLLITSLSFAAAIASFYCIERPFLKLKKRWDSPNKQQTSN